MFPPLSFKAMCCECVCVLFQRFLSSSARATHSSRSSSSSYSAQLAVVAVTAFLSSGGVPSQLQPHHFLLAKVGPVRRVFSACVAVLKQPSSNCIETYGWPCTHNSSLTNSLPLQKRSKANQRLRPPPNQVYWTRSTKVNSKQSQKSYKPLTSNRQICVTK